MLKSILQKIHLYFSMIEPKDYLAALGEFTKDGKGDITDFVKELIEKETMKEKTVEAKKAKSTEVFKAELEYEITPSNLEDLFNSNPEGFIKEIGIERILETIGFDKAMKHFAE